MVKIGNFFFHYRNVLFPLFYLILFLPSPELFQNPLHALVIGFAITLLGQATRMVTIGLAYIIRGGQNRRVYAENLVTEGIFTHCRNPLYVGNLLILIGLGIASNSMIFMCIFAPLFLFMYQAIVLAEENFLRNKFGEQFDLYTQKVNRWIPNFSGLSKTLSEMEFKWKRVIIKEYNTTFTWTVAGVLIVMKTCYLHPGWHSLDQQLPKLIGMIGLLLALYLFIRFLKKTKRLTSD